MFVGTSNRVARAMANRLRRDLTLPPAETAAYDRSNAAAILASAGVEPEEELRMRPDGRAVFLVRHPVWGRCILKATNSFRSAVAGWANMQIACFVRDGESHLFPKVYEATPNYTIEEYVRGTPFRRWMEGDRFLKAPLEDFLLKYREWGSESAPWAGGEYLHPHETRTIVDKHVGKCISQSSYLPPTRRVGALTDLLRSRREVESELAELMGQAEEIRIPRGRMCGDFSNVNLMVEESRNRIVIVDYEFVGPGNTGFDCAYLLTSLAKLPREPARQKALDAFIHSEEYAGSRELAGFFSLFSKVLTHISQTIYGTRA